MKKLLALLFLIPGTAFAQDSITINGWTVGDYLDFTIAAAPANPSAGFLRLYAKDVASDEFCGRTSAGVEICMSAGGGGSGTTLSVDGVGVGATANFDDSGDINFTNTAGTVKGDVDNVPAAATVAIDATEVTTGVLAGARGGVGIALPTCAGTDKLTANGTVASCAADVGGSGITYADAVAAVLAGF